MKLVRYINVYRIEIGGYVRDGIGEAHPSRADAEWQAAKANKVGGVKRKCLLKVTYK